MKLYILSVLASVMIQDVTSHSIFQELWVNGVDMQSTCNRLPSSNSPVTSPSSNDIRCNTGTSGVSGKCPAVAGQTVTVEMHAVRPETPLIEQRRY